MAVVEDFFDIIYSMHVESSSEPGKAPKHAGQKKTYRAVRLPLRVPWAARGWERRGQRGRGSGHPMGMRTGMGGQVEAEPLAGDRGEGDSCLSVRGGVRKESFKGRAAVLRRRETGLQWQHNGTAAGRGETK